MSTLNQDTIESHVRAFWKENPDHCKELTQIADDIWICDKPLATHTDPTVDGKMTYGRILMNELDLHLVSNGSSQSLNPGEVFRLNARLPHSAELPCDTTEHVGLFAALIWDMPEETQLDNFLVESETRVKEWLETKPSIYSHT